MEQLTEHFTLVEFTYSETAQRLGIDNTIPEEIIPNIKNLCEQVLEPLRNHIRLPVFISSGYRCKDLNKAVGGVANSQHQYGEAVDIKLYPEWALVASFVWISEHCPFDQLIFEKAGTSQWIHISCKRDITQNRKQVKRIIKG